MKLEEILKRCKEDEAACRDATSGPWECDWNVVDRMELGDDREWHKTGETFTRDVSVTRPTNRAVCVLWGQTEEGFENDFNNGKFIAHARTDITALVAEVRRLREGWPNRPERHGEYPDNVKADIAALEDKHDIELVDIEHHALIFDRMERLEQQRDDARRWATAWKQVAKVYWTSFHIDKKSPAYFWAKRAEEERDEARAEVERLRAKLVKMENLVPDLIMWDD